jgi:hypothetical protein
MLGHGLAALGDSCLHAGRVEEAIRHFSDALQVWRRLGNQWGAVCSMHALARGQYQAGRAAGARELLTDALAIMAETGHLASNEREANEIRTLLAEIG